MITKFLQHRTARLALLTLLTCAIVMPVHAGEPATQPAIAVAKLDRTTPVDFQSEILPILRDNCLACHNRTRNKAGLILETPADILKGSENGAVVVPGDADKSLLLQVSSHQAKPLMPPKDNKVSAMDLTSGQLGLLRLWINQGAKGEARTAARPIEWQAPASSLQSVYAVALSPDGRYAAAGRANRVDLYELPSQRYLGSLNDPQLTRSGLYGSAGAAHRDMVESLAFSPDGKLLVSGAFGEVKMWRRAEPKPQATIATPPGGVMAVSPDGRFVAVAGEGTPIQLFDAATGKAICNIAGSTSAARGIAFSPDGSTFAVVSADRGLRISSVAGALMAQTVVPSDVNAIGWVGGKQVVTAGADGVIRVWLSPEAPAISWAPPKELKGHGGEVTAVAALPDGSRLLSGGADGSIREWNLTDGQSVRQLSHGSPVTQLAVRPDGKFFASAGQANGARLWDAAKGSVVAELKGSASAGRELGDRERAQQLATANVSFAKAAVERTEAARKAAEDRLKAATDAKASADKIVAEKQANRAKAADDANAAQAQAATDAKAKPKADEAAKALEKAENELKPVVFAQANAQTEAQLANLAATRAADELATAKASMAQANDALQRADAALAVARQTAATADKAIRSLAFSPDNLTLATSAEDDAVNLWTADGGALLDTIRAKPPGLAVLAFCGDRRLCVADARQTTIWNLGDGSWSLHRTIGSGDGTSVLADRVNALAFSPDGRLLATGSGEPSRSGQIKLWDVATAKPIRDFGNVHTDSVLALEFSTDGKLLACGAADRFARIIDVATGKVLKSFEGHTDHVLGVSWKADGRVLATCSADNQVKFWDVASGDRKANVGGFGKAVNAVRFLGISDQALAVAADGQLRIVNDAGGAVRNVAGVAGDFFQAGAVTPDGRWIAVGGQNGQLVVCREPPATPPAVLAFPAPPR